MDWNQVEGNWKQVRGNVKKQWGKLTDDDLTAIDGRREALEGRIQERSLADAAGTIIGTSKIVAILLRGSARQRSRSRLRIAKLLRAPEEYAGERADEGSGRGSRANG